MYIIIKAKEIFSDRIMVFFIIVLITTIFAYSLVITKTSSEDGYTSPDVSLNVSGFITPDNPSVYVGASSTVAGVTFSWRGPEGFAAKVPNIVVAIPGTYTVTVTDPTNGHSIRASVEVYRKL